MAVFSTDGIVDGRVLASAPVLGCNGVVLDTRLWASNEALGHEDFKSRLTSCVIGQRNHTYTSY